MQRLPHRAVLRHLEQLADDLTPRQRARLTALADLIGEDGRIPMRQALDVATPGGGDVKAQDTFRKFRAALDEAATVAEIDLRLVSDRRKAPPADRFCWFEDADVTSEEVAERSQREAKRRTADEPVPASVSEVLQPVVHVETAPQASEALRRLERQFVTLLTEQVAAIPGYRVTSPIDLVLGADVDAERQRLRETADVVVELDSAAARQHTPAGTTTRRPLRFALEGVAPSAPAPAASRSAPIGRSASAGTALPGSSSSRRSSRGSTTDSENRCEPGRSRGPAWRRRRGLGTSRRRQRTRPIDPRGTTPTGSPGPGRD